ncbi:MAG: hypothetical protein FJ149_08645 [Euryarchaeota archaeon]|nr:hypothetical protein [Euryarchaeota archaeon]
MPDLAAMVGPFIVLLLLTFGLLLAVLGGFLLVFSRGKPRLYGGTFIVAGAAVLVVLLVALLRGVLLPGVNVIFDVLIPGLIYTAAFGIGAILALLPFLVVAVRT